MVETDDLWMGPNHATETREELDAGELVRDRGDTDERHSAMEGGRWRAGRGRRMRVRAHGDAGGGRRDAEA